MANDTKGKRPAQAAHEQLTAAQKRSREEEDEKWARFLAMRDGAQPPPDPAPAAPSPAPAPAPVSPRAPRAQRPPVVIANTGGTSSTGFAPTFGSTPAPVTDGPTYEEPPLPGAEEPLQESGPATGSSAPGWQLWGAAKAFTPREPRKHYLARIIVERKLSVFYGQPGSLKSMLVMDALMAIALGKVWLPPLPNAGAGPRGVATVRAPVLWVDFDNGEDTSDERVEALLRGHGAEDPALTARYWFYVSMPKPWLSASSRDSVNELAELVKQHGIKVVAIDNLGTVSLGVDENTSAMTEVMSNLRWLAESTGAAVVVIHHERKGNGTTGGKAGEALRGHSSINAALDLALLVEREGVSDVVTFRSTKTRGIKVTSLTAHWTYDHKPGTEGELLRGRFYGGGTNDDAGDDAAVVRAILEAAETPKNGTQLAAAVQKLLPSGEVCGSNRIRALADKLASRGAVKVTSGARGAKVYQTA